MTRLPLFLLLLPALASACSSWPRYGNLPQDSDVLDPGVDPRELIEIDWRFFSERELIAQGSNSSPFNMIPQELDSLEGLIIEGDLNGVGWSSDLEPLTVVGDCGDGPVEQPRDPGREGDWAGDVDFYRIDIASGLDEPVLCAQAQGAASGVGWDILLYEIDECGLPGEPLLGADSTVLGADLASPQAGWVTQVQSGRSYAVLIAGYQAPDPNPRYSYTLGLSIVPGAGGGELCPLLPAEPVEDDS